MLLLFSYHLLINVHTYVQMRMLYLYTLVILRMCIEGNIIIIVRQHKRKKIYSYSARFFPTFLTTSWFIVGAFASNCFKVRRFLN